MANRYWVGGTGDWDDSSTTHWSDTSGGSSGASIPTSSDDITFDKTYHGDPIIGIDILSGNASYWK